MEGSSGFIEFSINGTSYKVDRDVDANTKLVEFLRHKAVLTGTKWMCREGGCGACVVTMAIKDPAGDAKEYRAVNSCLLPLLSCHGSEIITIEGIGNKKDGYHPIQKTLADINGSQCGFCSPGMVMSAFSLMERKAGKGFTMKEVESSLEGNICRCTGYRPILDAFKSFANDAPTELKARCADLEDLGSNKPGICLKTVAACSGVCESRAASKTTAPKEVFHLGNWYRPESLSQLMDVLKSFNNDLKYRLVAGNTGTGVFKNDGPYEAYVDVSKVPELYQVTRPTPLTVGGGVTLTNFLALLNSIASTNPDYWYAPILAEHIGKIASVPVRNSGSIAGNLMMKHAHPEFPSDVFIVLETVGAKLKLVGRNGKEQEVCLLEFLKTDMQGQVILNLTLPPLSTDYVIKTYKIMPRYANAHAYVNAGFRAKVQSYRIVEKPTIIFGGFRPSFVHAEKTEEFLNGKDLSDEAQFQSALKILDQELNSASLANGMDNNEFLIVNADGTDLDHEKPSFNVEEDSLIPDMKYLKTVAQGLLYKYALIILGNKVGPKIKSGADDLKRGLSSGKQDFDTDQKEWPVHQPVIKVEARAQCSGEAQYFDDIPLRANELHGAFVLSTFANCELDSIDPSAALKADGVVAYFDAKNIKHSNKFTFDKGEDEEVFCSGKVLYAGQSLGLVVARTQMQAMEAAKLVQVKYRNLRKPVLTVKEALQYPERIMDQSAITDDINTGNVEEGWTSSETIIEGEFEVPGQYHFHMETQITICIPTEDGMDVFCGTQDHDAVQNVLATVLNMQKNQINIQVRRLGGGFGAKITRSNLIAAACGIAAAELSKPVRIHLDLNTNMELVGGRIPCYCTYKAGVNKEGRLQAVDLTLYSNCGCNFNEGLASYAAVFAKNCYSAKSWKITPRLAKTDMHANTACRSPGTTEGIAVIENLVEHMARVLNEDPLVFRLKNMNPKDGETEKLIGIVDQLRLSSDYEERVRQVKEFNANNRWKKRGIRLVPMVYPVDYAPDRYNVLVAINHNGGSVSVSHGGIEMGQGINTKVAQVVAKELAVDLSMVSVKPTNSLTNANGAVTGGSLTSELNCYAAMRACQKLNDRMRPVKEKMPSADWKTLVEKCYEANIDLTARHYRTARDKLNNYVIHGATVAEVEVDVLTGEKMIRRVDLLEDAGQSLSPLVDIGQVEGAFVMGIGLWTSEKITFDPITGQKLTNGTWNYKPPICGDIPVDFRVTLLKNAAQQFGVLRSKATGEPPLCMSVSVLFAIRDAVNAARNETGDTKWYQMDGPATIDKIHTLMLVNPAQFLFR